LAVGLGFAALVAASLLAGEIGGDRVSFFTATTAHQDPHQIQARPALIARLRAADLVACTGAELRSGRCRLNPTCLSRPDLQPIRALIDVEQDADSAVCVRGGQLIGRQDYGRRTLPALGSPG